ncbi:LysR family transcriptional regulator [Clostridium sp. E02]|uniref:LysR family transcriptional regulator n=1 Tax=Clostridium sp. E02 TaxID=2487134 RepID=UPI000F51FF86|nr:LysR family transcriptional regulator [Clostridium sp. E02]
MNIRHLTIFKMVCEKGSITGAGKSLSMTQPAISHAINELEESVGSPLFDRVSRKVVMNENGKFYLSKVIPLLELYQDLENYSGLLHLQAPLRIGSCVTLASHLLPQIVTKFKTTNPDIQVNVTVDTSESITTQLLKNQLDICLIEGVIPEDQLERIPFSSYPMAVICAPGHPLSKSSSQPVPLDRLIKEPLLLREKGCTIRDSFDCALSLNNLSAEPLWISSSSDVIIKAVKEQLGIGIIPRIWADESIKRGDVIEIEIKDLNLSCMNHVVFHKDKFQTEAFQAFINLVLFDS